MLETEKLRKADIFSGTAIFILGLFIISQAMQMPMKDSYAGVQNVWYVSPALFPMFIGAMLTLLGVLLMRTAIKAVGVEGLKSVFAYFGSPDFIVFLKRKDTVRYYAIILNLLVYVFILIPRIDFFLASILFLLIFFFEFYCAHHEYLLKLIYLELFFSILLVIVIASGLGQRLNGSIPFAIDFLVCISIACLIFITSRQPKETTEQIKKFKRSIIIAFVAPFTIGIIFKYFLLVPMPFEGLVVSILDTIWYADFWS